MDAWLLGLALGFSAGVNPGPLTMLVIRQSLVFGARAGVLASTAPLVTDSFAILLAFLVARNLPSNFEFWLEIIGGIFLIYLGIKGLQPVSTEATANTLQSFKEALIVNVTNPHMYIFWFAFGLSQLQRPIPEPLWFLLGFYPAIVGSKAAIAIVVAKTRDFPWIRPLARWSNALLILIGIYLCFKALRP